MKSILSLLLLIVSMSVEARIGETYEECVDRYGNPIEQDDVSVVFAKSGIMIVALFNADGICDFIFFQKRQTTDWSSEEVNTILKANLGSELKQGVDGSDPLWSNSKGVIATYNESRAVLTITTEAGMKRREDAQNAKRSVNDF